jgi:hypothetical protein
MWDESAKAYISKSARRYHTDKWCPYLRDQYPLELTVKYAEFRNWSVCKVCAGTKLN